MEPCIAGCVFYITNEIQLIHCSFIIIGALHVSGGFSAHHQELIKLYVQPWILSRFPAVYRWRGWAGTFQQAEQSQPIHTSGRQQESMTIRKAAHTVL